MSFAEISNITALGEVSCVVTNCVPELSFGTHFFQDLVESNIFYVALFPESNLTFFNTKFLDDQPNIFSKILPEHQKHANTIKVYDVKKYDARLISDIITQKLILIIK